jgi:uncharacterized coiled-coil protein SlyX
VINPQRISILEHRVSELEKAVKELTKLVEMAGETGRRKTFKVPKWVKRL